MSKKQKKEIPTVWTDKFTNKVPIEELGKKINEYWGYISDMEELPYKNRLELELNNYGSFNEILTELLQENGGYIKLYRDKNFDDEDIHLAHGYGYGESQNPFAPDPPEGWNEDHHCEVIFFYELFRDLEKRVRKAYIYLKHARKLPKDVIPAWELKGTSEQGEGEECLSYFNLDVDDKELLAILNRFKTVEWTYKRVKHKGFFAREVSDDEWLTAMKGTEGKRPELKNKIPWLAKYVCKSFVQQYLDGKYELAEKIFCLRGSEELKDLANTNISKNKNICDEHTGQIAHIIRRAMSQ